MQSIGEQLLALKKRSGSHSPSISTVRREIPDINIQVDACFLSNPYATELFMDYLQLEILSTGRLKDILEYYPAQNHQIAAQLSKVLDIPSDNIVVGNGAIQLIEHLLRQSSISRMVLPIPTFSSYYEAVEGIAEVIYHHLSADELFEYNLDAISSTIQDNNADCIVLINPNNPTGGYIKAGELEKFIVQNREQCSLIIVDESFIHFTTENDGDFRSIAQLVTTYPELVVIKSMSKDFGIAGIRAGYAVMNTNRAQSMLKGQLLWNSNGLAEYFFDLYSRPEFQEQYASARTKYLAGRTSFLEQLSTIQYIRPFPSQSNFVLMQIIGDKITAEELFIRLLSDFGIYVRHCADKIGLDDSYIRVAIRDEKENTAIIDALTQIATELYG